MKDSQSRIVPLSNESSLEDFKYASDSLKVRLSKSETECLKNLNDAIKSARDNHLKRHSLNLSSLEDNTATILDAGYEVRCNSVSNVNLCSQNFVHEKVFWKDLHHNENVIEQISKHSIKSVSKDLKKTSGVENMETELPSSSFNVLNFDLPYISPNPNKNSQSISLENVLIATDSKCSDDECYISCAVSIVNDSFEKFLHKKSAKCALEKCSQLEIDAIKNTNSNEDKTTYINEKVEVCQKRNENLLHDDSVSDMKAVVCQVLRTWTERQAESVRSSDPHSALSYTKVENKNVTNVREYVKQIESSIQESAIKQKSKKKKDLYTNILHRVLEEDESEKVIEVREETRQLMDETSNAEQWKKKFQEILYMFQALADNWKKPQTNHKHKCFNYINGPEEDKNKLKSQSFNTFSTTKCVASIDTMLNLVCDKRNVAEQTDIISQSSFCCQVSLSEIQLANEVQTNEIISRTINDDKQDLCVLIEQEQNTTGENSSTSRELNTEGSGMLLTKVSGSRTNLLPLSHMRAPCERDFHTIHIEAHSSPPSSILHRQPLCTRFWNVIKDFCIAACFCIQVNKDCIFCVAFFVIFVMCTSLLTAFFYRTLNPDSRMLQHHMIRLQGSTLETY